MVLVPAAALLALSPEALEALLIHELAHVRRGDFFANLLQTFAEALLFYHPAVWWLSGRIRQEREHCCDDAAVQACGDSILYASALTELEALRSQPLCFPDLAPAASGGRLMSRIKRLLQPHPVTGIPSPMAAFVPAFLLLTAMGTAALSARNASDLPPTKQAPAHADLVTLNPLGTDATEGSIPKVPIAPRSANIGGSTSASPVVRAAALSARNASDLPPTKQAPTHAGPAIVNPLGTDATEESIPKVPIAPRSANKDTIASASQAVEPQEMEFNRIRIAKQPAAPPYPPLAKKARIQGNVVVLITTNERGKVASAMAISGPRELHACAEDYAKAWIFKPAMVNDKPVPARFKLTMPFRLMK